MCRASGCIRGDRNHLVALDVDGDDGEIAVAAEDPHLGKSVPVAVRHHTTEIGVAMCLENDADTGVGRRRELGLRGFDGEFREHVEVRSLIDLVAACHVPGDDLVDRGAE